MATKLCKMDIVFVALFFIGAQASQSRRLNDDERQAVVDKHNELRRIIARGQANDTNGNPLSPAENMIEMVYSQDAEDKAYEWAGNCTWKHSGRSGYGENLYFVSAFLTNWTAELIDGTQSWYSEVESYSQNVIDFEGSSVAIGHFTQVIWANTGEVGCAINNCAPETGLSSNGSYMVCNYKEQGNIISYAIYEPGTACTSCGYGYSCDNDLCKLEDDVANRTTGAFLAGEQTIAANIINRLRRSVAKGEFNLTSSTQLPAATNMLEIVYDATLGDLAATQVADCGYPSTNDSISFALILSGGEPDYLSIPYALNFIKDSPYNGSISTYDGSNDNFANLIWATAENVGCAAVYCTDNKYAYVNCVFSNTRGAVKNQTVYEEGTAASACPTGYVANDGLCSLKSSLTTTASPSITTT